MVIYPKQNSVCDLTSFFFKIKTNKYYVKFNICLLEMEIVTDMEYGMVYRRNDDVSSMNCV